MWINVRSIDGKISHRIDGLSKLTKIEDLRKKLKEKFNAPPDRQRLFYRGKQLEDGHTLFDYDVGLNDIIQIMIRPKLAKVTENKTQSFLCHKKSTSNSICSEDEDFMSDKENIVERTTKSSRQNVFSDDMLTGGRVEVSQSNYFKVGDLVDARDQDNGTWWEAQIVGILYSPSQNCDNQANNCITTPHRSTSNVPSSDDSSENEEAHISLWKSSCDENYNEKGFKSKQYENSLTSNDDNISSDQKPPEDNCIYLVFFQRYTWDEDPVLLKLKDIRYRAHEIITFEDITEGMNAMVNYNTENPRERGYWYDCLITHKKSTRTQKELFGTIYIDYDNTGLEKCQIFFINEVYKIPETLVELSSRTFDLQMLAVENNFPCKRPVKPECSHCNDHPTRKCRYCSCAVCGGKNQPHKQILCDECNMAYHLWCLDPPLTNMPEEDEWYCPSCKNDETEVVRAGEKLKESKKKAKMASRNTLSTRDWGKGMACVGRTKECTIVPPDHFGAIPGVEVGMQWRFRVQVSEAGVHRPHVAGIHGRETLGAFSIVLSGGYEDDVDNGEEFFYTGSGGRDLSGNKRTAEQSCDQTLTRMNRALALNCAAPLNAKTGAEAKNWKDGKPVRVVRNYKGRKHSKYCPEEGMRYDGIYKIVKYWPQKGKSGFIVWRYLLRRDDPSPAPWTKAGKKFIKDMGFTMQYPEGYLEGQESKEVNAASKKTPLSNIKRKSEEQGQSPKKAKSILLVLPDKCKNLIQQDKKNEKLWKESLDCLHNSKVEFLKKVEELFLCICCQELVYEPVTTECFHNFCKSCLQRSFKAEVYCCPTCRRDFGKNYPLNVNKALSQALKSLFPGYEAGR